MSVTIKYQTSKETLTQLITLKKFLNQLLLSGVILMIHLMKKTRCYNPTLILISLKLMIR